ncbi:MAG TPA: hypothetical protein VK789_30850 [Bryobacteraceae bacterium]|nr:hypothetical protein [Bryobacteraceae bacterium]
MSFREAWEARESGELDGLDVVFIGREPLIRNKKATGRAKDPGDVEELRRKSD